MDIGRQAAALFVAMAILSSFGLAWAGQKTATFSVRGLSCSTDEVCVSNKLKALPGVTSSSVDGIESKVIATFDDEKITADAIKSAIEDEGYGVDKVEVK